MAYRFYISAFFILTVGLHIRGATVYKTIYINRGKLVTVNSISLPALAFNISSKYSSQNEILKLTTNDSLVLRVVNNDSVAHGFAIKDYSNINSVISPKDSITKTIRFKQEGVFIYYDSYQNPKFRYLGAAGMITVFNSSNDKKFYWNLKEHQSSYNELISQNKKVDWSNYTPDYFTINSYSFPEVLDDTVSRVYAMVGDTVRIFITNTGQSAHVLHIHGFHGKIVFSSIPKQKGWIKDSFPIFSMETMIIELIPDKRGFYSVHDHNLLAITAGGVYQTGMLTLMQFEE